MAVSRHNLKELEQNLLQGMQLRTLLLIEADCERFCHAGLALFSSASLNGHSVEFSEATQFNCNSTMAPCTYAE